MRQKHYLCVAAVLLTLAMIAITTTNIVSAEQAGAAGVGGAGGYGGGGGAGGIGGYGGGGGRPVAGGALSAFGDYVYVLDRGTLYQYAAYDLKLVKKSNLNGNGAGNRGRAGQVGGRGGDGAAGENGAAGRGGAGGAGGSTMGRSEDVAAYGEFVYVLEGESLRKLYANGLKPIKAVTLNFEARVE